MTRLLLAGASTTWLVAGDRLATPDGAPAPRLDCAGAQLWPGAVNAHTHLYSGLAPLGMPAPALAPASFLEILERVWWRLDRALDAASLRASARLYLAEALLAGTTTLIDHHESPAFIDGSLDVLAEAAEELGARVLTCYGASERNGGRAEGQRGLEECARFARRHPATTPAGTLARVRGLVGLHASFTVSDDTVREAGALARELGTVVHVHVAEDGADVVDARRRGHDGPLERLLALEALPPGSILAHGVHLDAGAVRRADALGLWLVQNPRSNLGNRVGYPHALKGQGIVPMLKAVDGAYAAAMTKLSTPKLTRLLLDAVARQQPPRHSGFRPKMRYAHQGGMNPPVIVVHGSALDHVSASYTRYLERTFQEAFKLQGTPLRIQFKSGHNPFATKD